MNEKIANLSMVNRNYEKRKPRIKTTTSEVTNEGARSRMETQRRNDCENRATEMITSEEEREKSLKKWTVSETGRTKYSGQHVSNCHLNRLGKEQKKAFEDIMVEKFPNMVNLKIQDHLRTPSRIHMGETCLARDTEIPKIKRWSWWGTYIQGNTAQP